MRFKGWKPIFAFTYLQQVKSKGFIASTITVCVLIIAIAVIIGVISFSGIGDIIGGDDSDGVNDGIDTLYICNETDIPDFDSSLVEFNIVSVPKEKLEEVQERVKNSTEPGRCSV